MWTRKSGDAAEENWINTSKVKPENVVANLTEGSGKTTLQVLAQLLGRKAKAKTIADAQRNDVPYYRQFDKRK
ncbi:hypothetical protein A8H39_01330 [Paraburkholderia fungorum]|nr:hypothetical protein A8H39_01330 [Paraburkholderia fungorum]